MSAPVFKVEKGIPVPDNHSSGRKPKYPLGKMLVGESFAYPSELKQKICLAASQYGRRHKRKYVTQCTNGTGRCWRVK